MLQLFHIVLLGRNPLCDAVIADLCVAGMTIADLISCATSELP
jgi:hypothetical protein